jgi:hypothetical protein
MTTTSFAQSAQVPKTSWLFVRCDKILNTPNDILITHTNFFLDAVVCAFCDGSTAIIYIGEYNHRRRLNSESYGGSSGAGLGVGAVGVRQVADTKSLCDSKSP